MFFASLVALIVFTLLAFFLAFFLTKIKPNKTAYKIKMNNAVVVPVGRVTNGSEAKNFAVRIVFDRRREVTSANGKVIIVPKNPVNPVAKAPSIANGTVGKTRMLTKSASVETCPLK